MSASRFLFEAKVVFSKDVWENLATDELRFRLHFGATPATAAKVWEKIPRSIEGGEQPKHLLMALFKLKTYTIDDVCASMFKTSRKTFHKWSWIFIRRIASLNEITLTSRFTSAQFPSLFMSIDGTDCRIYEPYPFDRKWYSHKSHGPGLRYEIGLNLFSDTICWVHGPFPCGRFNDESIFNKDLSALLQTGEKVIADKGYRGPQFLGRGIVKVLSSRARARHETLNRRIKTFNAVGGVFRHNVKLHGLVFHACAQLVQITLANDGRLFSV